MPSYRRHVARHPQARARALRFVRRHAWQTGPFHPGALPDTCQDCSHQDHAGRRVCREFHCLCGLKRAG